MHNTYIQHWAIGLLLAVVLHISAAWAIFRESPAPPEGKPATGLSIEVFSSGMESLAASDELEDVEVEAAPDPVESTVAEVPEVETLDDELPPEPELEVVEQQVPPAVDETPVEDVEPEQIVNTVEPLVTPPPAPEAVVTEQVQAKQPKKPAPTATVTDEPVKVARESAIPPASTALTLASVEQPGVAAENIRDSYFASISALLAQSKRYPGRAVRRKLEGVVKVQLVIDRNGELVSFDIAETSSHRILDKEVERMVQRTAPFPEIPTEIAGNTLAITVPVVFFLR